MLRSANGSFEGGFLGLCEAGVILGDSGAPGAEAPPNDGLIIGWPYIIGCWGIIGTPVPDAGRPNPAAGCAPGAALAAWAPALPGGTDPCIEAVDGPPDAHVAGATFGCQLAPPVSFFSPAFH